MQSVAVIPQMIKKIALLLQKNLITKAMLSALT